MTIPGYTRHEIKPLIHERRYTDGNIVKVSTDKKFRPRAEIFLTEPIKTEQWVTLLRLLISEDRAAPTIEKHYRPPAPSRSLFRSKRVTLVTMQHIRINQICSRVEKAWPLVDGWMECIYNPATIRTRTWKGAEFPVAIARRMEGLSIEVICPYCNARHMHGRGSIDSSGDGHRVPHCRFNASKFRLPPQYYVSTSHDLLVEQVKDLPRRLRGAYIEGIKEDLPPAIMRKMDALRRTA